MICDSYRPILITTSIMNLNRIAAQSIFYPTLWWNMLLGRVLNVRNWWDPVNEHITIGAWPFARDVSQLAKEGINAVVNTCEEYEGPVAEYKKHGIQQMRMPTIDFTHPKYEDVSRAVEFIEQQVAAGKKTYVHCKAGRARSATVVICWLIKHQQMTAAEGQRLLLEKRSHVNPRLPQREVVQRFEREYLKSEI